MTKTILLGASLAALFAVGMVSTIFAVNAGQFDIESASTDGETLTMTVAEKIKQIPENKADDLITFYAWVTITDDGLELTQSPFIMESMITRHLEKQLNLLQYKAYHPHGVSFDSDFCIVGLDSPKAKFKVQHDTVTLESENSFDFAATGTVGPRSECTATGLGITNLYDTL